MRPSTREELEELVNRLIDERVAEGELNDCNLTFRELQTIKEVFMHILQGVHHPRIRIPEPVARSQSASLPDAAESRRVTAICPAPPGEAPTRPPTRRSACRSRQHGRACRHLSAPP